MKNIYCTFRQQTTILVFYLCTCRYMDTMSTLYLHYWVISSNHSSTHTQVGQVSVDSGVAVGAALGVGRVEGRREGVGVVREVVLVVELWRLDLELEPQPAGRSEVRVRADRGRGRLLRLRGGEHLRLLLLPLLLLLSLLLPLLLPGRGHTDTEPLLLLLPGRCGGRGGQGGQRLEVGEPGLGGGGGGLPHWGGGGHGGGSGLGGGGGSGLLGHLGSLGLGLGRLPQLPVVVGAVVAPRVVNVRLEPLPAAQEINNNNGGNEGALFHVLKLLCIIIKL